MKQLLFILFLLLIPSLACKTLMPGPIPIETPTKIQTSIPSSIIPVTSTPLSIPEPITCVDDSCLNACLQRIEETIPTSSYEALSGIYAGDNIEFNLVYYKVEDGKLSEPQVLYVPDEFEAYQQDLTAHQNIWQYASGLLPADELKWIDGFEIFSSSNYAGWVSPGGGYQDDRSKWILGVDIASAQDPSFLTNVLVHEYGHLITLNTDQIVSDEFYSGWWQDPEGCSQFLSPDGCSNPDSYINLFYQKFWQGDLYDAWLEEVEKPQVDSSDEYRTLIDKFYESHSEQFVSDYASTNIDEDLAESFERFVLEPKPDGNGVPEQKIRFFYDFPEMVKIRQTMIQNICSYTQ